MKPSQERQRAQDLGHTLLLGPVDRVLWGYQSLTQGHFFINDSVDDSGCEDTGKYETSGIAKVASQIFSDALETYSGPYFIKSGLQVSKTTHHLYNESSFFIRMFSIEKHFYL